MPSPGPGATYFEGSTRTGQLGRKRSFGYNGCLGNLASHVKHELGLGRGNRFGAVEGHLRGEESR